MRQGIKSCYSLVRGSQKDSDVEKLHECGLSIYCIIFVKELKRRHTFATESWYAHKQTDGHKFTKQAIEQKIMHLSKDENLHQKKPKVKSSLLAFNMGIN